MQAALTDNLVAWWTLGETSGTRFDCIGSNDLTDNNTVGSAAGIQGNAADFEETAQEYLKTNDNPELSTGDIDFSITAWVMLESKTVGNHREIVVKGINNSSNLEYRLYYHTDLDRFVFEVADGTTLTDLANTTLGSPAIGQWYFLVAWHDAGGDTLNISVGVDNPGRPTTVDFYFGALLPDGNTIVFFTDLNFNFAEGVLTDLSTLSPIASGVDLSGAFTVNDPSFFSFVWTGGEPPGTYTFFLAAVIPGGFADGTADPGDIIALGTADFTFTP